MKKNSVKALALGVIISSLAITTAFAAGNIKSAVFTNYKIYLNNKNIPLSKSLVSVIANENADAVTYAPVRELLENLGYNVRWNGKDNSIHLSPKLVSTPEEFENQTFPLISADYDKDTYLYSVGNNQSVLKYKGILKAFDWVCTTPRFRLPEMRVLDYDKDGEDEVAVSLNVGSGTGVSVYELHVVEKKKDAGDFIDNKFMPKDYMEQISGNISYKVVNDETKTLINISSKKSSVNIDITGYAQDISAKDADIRLGYGDIIEFEIKEDGKIELTAGLGVWTEKLPSPMYIAQLRAGVTYTDGKFSLSDARITEW